MAIPMPWAFMTVPMGTAIDLHGTAKGLSYYSAAMTHDTAYSIAMKAHGSPMARHMGGLA